jgi:hypothetical protein
MVCPPEIVSGAGIGCLRPRFEPMSPNLTAELAISYSRDWPLLVTSAAEKSKVGKCDIV